MSPSLYGFVRDHGPVSPEVVASEFLALANTNGAAKKLVKKLVGKDPRFLWNKDGSLAVTDPASLALDEASYVVFDVETTGSSSKEGAITEIGAVKVVRGVISDEFSTLINPERPIESFVMRLTGITNNMVEDAPLAAEVMPRFEEFVEGSILVGHNVGFDCSFVGAAREASGLTPLTNPVLDTLKLARFLVPGLKRYRLSSLVAHLGINQAPNHRALADASATAEVFVQFVKMLRSAGVKGVGEAITLRSGRSKIKAQKQHLAENIPNTPGVYYFVDKDETVLYVGKAKDLKARVRTYFSGGDGRRKIGRLVEEVAEVKFRETQSELHALIFEAREIRRLLPRYNSVGRTDKTSWFIKLDANEPYPIPERVRSNVPAEGVTFLGPYRSAGVLDACIEALGRIFPLRRCGGENEVCFYGQMGRCGPCLGMDEARYRTEVLDEVVSLMRGEGGEEHLAALVRERERLAKELEFEAAARLRDLISGIERIRLTRAVVTAEGTQAIVAHSTEPGLVEVFALNDGKLVDHQSFEIQDKAGLSGFAQGVLSEKKAGPDIRKTDPEKEEISASDEARVVAAYLRRRQAVIEASGMRCVGDLLELVERLEKTEGESDVAALA